MSKDQLDISILALNKVLTDENKISDFLNKHIHIEAKSDGIKISLFHIDNSGDYKKDFIVAYKGNIIYPEEFDFVSDYQAKNRSINNAQIKLIWNHLKDIDSSKLPLNYEFFLEFLMKKPTLSNNYTKKGLILIAYSKTSYKVEFGKIKSKPLEFNTIDREKYAKILKVNTPLDIFDGVLNDFKDGILDKTLMSLYNQSPIKQDQLPSVRLAQISKLLLDIPSLYGGKEEGVIITLDSGRKFKIQQEYQVDQDARTKIKNQYRGTPEEETEYYKKIYDCCYEIYNKLKSTKIEDIMKEVANILSKYKVKITHPKKTSFQIKEDIQITLKNIIIKRLKGNNNFLFLGKMRVLTLMHYNIIKKGLQDYDGGVVCLVNNKETKHLEELRKKMLKACFPGIEIVTTTSGFIPSIINKCSKNINVILCGTDRFDDYTKQMSSNPEIKVVETPRTTAISATKVIENLKNELYFKRNTPKEIHFLYDEIKQAFNVY